MDDSIAITPAAESFQSVLGWPDVAMEGPVRQIESGGQRGLQSLSVKSYLRVNPSVNTINHANGSLTFWLFPMEDFGYACEHGLFLQHEADCMVMPLLTDHLPLRDLSHANFFLAAHPRWWRQLLFRFNRYAEGPKGFYECHGEHAAFGPCHLELPGKRWHQLGLTWDHRTQDYFLYVNGVRVANGHRWVRQALDECGPSLYAGSPAFAYGDLAFYDRTLSGKQLKAVYRTEAGEGGADSDEELRRTHEPESLPELKWERPDEYRMEMDLSLCREDDLKAFYIQGHVGSVKVTGQGLFIETPLARHPAEGLCQVYLHTWRTFEGDLDVEFEFMTLKEEGLALLMVHSSGMQREDYMRDYPLRTSSSMDMVHRENVRNYHWEFWREMDGIRSDVSTHVFVKNPRLRPLAYQAMPGLMEKNVWHKVRLIQDGRRFIGAVNGRVVFDEIDHPFDGSGPVYDFGHVSLRNMFKSKCLWRNLQIRVRPPAFRPSPVSSTNPPDPESPSTGQPFH